MEEPPETILKQGTHHHLIVTLAHVAPVMERLLLRLLIDFQVSPECLHMLYSMLADLLFE